MARRLPTINQTGTAIQGEFSFPSQSEDFRDDSTIQKDLLTQIASSLLQISSNVASMSNILPDLLDAQKALVGATEGDALKQEELAREGKLSVGKQAAVGVLGGAPGSIFGAFEKVFAILTPLLLGFALTLTDLNDPIELVKDALKAFAIFMGGKFLYQLLKSVTIAVVTEKVKGIFAGRAAGSAAGGITAATTGGIAGDVAGSTTGGAGPSVEKMGALTRIGKGIADLGSGIGAAITSFMKGFADGIAAFGNAQTLKGIGVITLATAAIGGLAFLFKKGELKPEDFIAVGAGLVTLAGGLLAMGSAPVLAAARGLGAALVPMAKASAVIALLGTALIPGAYAFSLFGEALKTAGEGTDKMIDNLFRLTEIDSAALYKIGPAIMSVGMGFAAFNAAMAVGSLASMGQAILGFFGVESPMEKVLRFAKEAKNADLIGAAHSIDAFAVSLQKLNNIRLENLDKIGLGLTAMSAGLVSFSAANVVSGVTNLVDRFLSFVSGGKTPIEQIVKLSKDSSGIYQAGMGIKALGSGMVSFNSVDPKRVTETVQIVTNLTKEQIEVLSKIAVVGTQIQQAQTLERTRNEVDEKKTAREQDIAQPAQQNINVSTGGTSVTNTTVNHRPLQAEEAPMSRGLGSKAFA